MPNVFANKQTTTGLLIAGGYDNSDDPIAKFQSFNGKTMAWSTASSVFFATGIAAPMMLSVLYDTYTMVLGEGVVASLHCACHLIGRDRTAKHVQLALLFCCCSCLFVLLFYWVVAGVVDIWIVERK